MRCNSLDSFFVFQLTSLEFFHDLSFHVNERKKFQKIELHLLCRTKLKQNEVDCEFLKKCCESLTDENKRLKKELQELQSTKAGASSPLFIQLQKATTCPSCERIMRTSDEGKNAAVNIDVVLKNNKWQRGFNAIN